MTSSPFLRLNFPSRDSLLRCVLRSGKVSWLPCGTNQPESAACFSPQVCLHGLGVIVGSGPWWEYLYHSGLKKKKKSANAMNQLVSYVLCFLQKQSFLCTSAPLLISQTHQFIFLCLVQGQCPTSSINYNSPSTY